MSWRLERIFMVVRHGCRVNLKDSLEAHETDCSRHLILAITMALLKFRCGRVNLTVEPFTKIDKYSLFAIDARDFKLDVWRLFKLRVVNYCMQRWKILVFEFLCVCVRVCAFFVMILVSCLISVCMFMSVKIDLLLSGRFRKVEGWNTKLKGTCNVCS